MIYKYKKPQERLPIVLLMAAYNEANPSRANEYRFCLTNNKPFFETIHIFLEDEKTWADNLLSGVKCTRVHERMKYSTYFDVANSLYNNKVIAISNADILFDETLGGLLNCDLTNAMACISKYNEGEKSPFYAHGSQDVWVFRSPIIKFPCDWSLGLPRCEVRLNYEADAAGIRLFNPCLSVKLTHIHKTKVRHYSHGVNDVPGNIKYICPSWIKNEA